MGMVAPRRLVSPGPIADGFVKSRAFICGIIGPVGSGKTIAALQKGLRIAAQQLGVVRADGVIVRKARIGVIRESYPSLESTTLKSWFRIVPEAEGKFGWKAPYGFSDADWDVIRATPIYEPNGRALLQPHDVKEQRLADRLLEMILTETDAAVPVPTARARATLSFGQRPGSFGGEIIRSIGQYKSFGVSLLLIHGGRLMAENGSGRAAYAAGALTFGTTLGALSLWLRDLRNGQDPRPGDNAGFWGQAMMQGVGFGPIGDYINAVTSERTNSLPQAIAGATTGGLSDLGQLLLGNGAETVGWMTDEKTQKSWNEQTGAGREVVNFAKRYAPGTSLWYLRTAVERNLFDQMQMLVDPRFQQSWDSRERDRVKRGSPTWWMPGERLPDRAPDYANALGRDDD